MTSQKVASSKKQEVTIGEMLAVVKELWFKIDDGRDMIELELKLVAKMLVEIGVIPDESAAIKYI
jgi:hypothetical protein